MKRMPVFVLIAAVAIASSIFNTSEAARKPSWKPVTEQRLLDAAHSNGWLMWMRTYSGDGHAPFDQINTGNVSHLRTVFTHSVDIPDGFEAPPIVNGSVMVVTTPMDDVYALDATNGNLLWQYDPHVNIRGTRTACCDLVNRGVAAYGNDVYIATLDSRVIALNASTGKVVWQKRVYPKPGVGYTMTSAPLAVNGMIVVGDGAGEFGGRGFLVALDAKTGALRWKTYTVPAPNQPGGNTWERGAYKHGGADPWVTGTYDPETKTLFWGTGNPGPWLSEQRNGRSLYSDSILALDPANGHIKWYFQETPGDPWDYDAVGTPALADVTIGGRLRHVLMQAGRNGYFYVVDRTDGKLISATPITAALSVTGYDASRDIGTIDTSKIPAPKQTVFTCPASLGGTNWWPASYDPQTHASYVATLRSCMDLTGGAAAKWVAGLRYTDESFVIKPVPGSDRNWGELHAIDVTTGKPVWTHETKLPWSDGTLTTGGGLAFSGTPDGYFYAFDAKTGRVLWKTHTRSGIIGVPVSYRVNGKQYVAVQTGWGGVMPFGGGKTLAPLFRGIPLGGRLYVFSL